METVLVAPTRGQRNKPAVAVDTAHSLFQVFEKLSEMVERRPSPRCPLSDRKRPRPLSDAVAVRGGQGGSPKKVRDTEGCLSGHMTKSPGNVGLEQVHSGTAVVGLATPAEAWFCQEPGGVYRCLICTYVCSQQRALKTHAWKHAGLLHCSYPVFQDGPLPEAMASSPALTPPSPALKASPAFAATTETAVELQVTVETEVGVFGLDSLGGESHKMGCLGVVEEGLSERGEMLLTHSATDANARPLEEVEEKEEEEEDTSKIALAVEDVPPFRRRTASESLRLHSLAAEALVAMPMAGAEPPPPSVPEALSTPPSPAKSPARSPVQTGISLSLLSVIQRLRERTNQDASDEDVLRELRDKAQGVVGESPPCLPAHPYAEGLEDHATQHRQTMVHCCQQRGENNKENQHEYGETLATMVPVIKTMVTTDSSLEKKAVKEAPPGQSVYRCDTCSYSSSSAIGVRKHQRIHCSEKLYRCTLCGYVCSHPPSLKSHMWKHAGDQNYNYEQVNRAIDDSIPRSGRPLAVPQSPGPGFCRWQWAGAAEDDTEKATPERAVDGFPSAASCPAGSPGTTVPAPLAPAAEYCVLLFCCCICGFESPSREQLMQHIQRHKGEIVSVILSREQPSAPPTGR